MAERVVIVTGSRDWADSGPIYRALDDACPTLVVEGGARGADAIARAWAKDSGVRSYSFNANWHKYGGFAGPLRNRLMLQAYPNAIVLAFPLDGPGTKDCIEQARQMRMRVLIYPSPVSTKPERETNV
jgi:hypothetical protein